MTDPAWLQRAPAHGDAVWTQLASAVATGDVVLHGSQAPGLTVLEPRAPVDHSIDLFSGQSAVFATEDPTWAMSYGVRSALCRRFLNACFYPCSSPGDWSQRRIFLSYAATPDGRAPVSPGVVYLLPSAAFTRMPSYHDPVFGQITECQWVSTDTVPVLAEVPVAPANLPRRPLLHEFDAVAQRADQNPEGFPWLS
ncbi:hypothetical protein F7P69_07075 [Cellulosimicrobium funkei]|nr:hypothetical protein [Cellulosimicrobium funkei]